MNEQVVSTLDEISAYFVGCFDNAPDGGLQQARFKRYLETLSAVKDMLSKGKPRLLSFDEVRTNVVYWVERKLIHQPWPICLRCIKNQHLLTSQKYEDWFGESWDADEYGKEWRCWTDKPSEEQMKGAKWLD